MVDKSASGDRLNFRETCAVMLHVGRALMPARTLALKPSAEGPGGQVNLYLGGTLEMPGCRCVRHLSLSACFFLCVVSVWVELQ